MSHGPVPWQVSPLCFSPIYLQREAVSMKSLTKQSQWPKQQAGCLGAGCPGVGYPGAEHPGAGCPGAGYSGAGYTLQMAFKYFWFCSSGWLPTHWITKDVFELYPPASPPSLSARITSMHQTQSFMHAGQTVYQLTHKLSPTAGLYSQRLLTYRFSQC